MEYVIKQKEKYKEYLINKDEELFNLNISSTCPGSKVYASATGNNFILGPDYKWYYDNESGELVEPGIEE